MTLTKADLIQDIAAAIGLNKREAAEMVEAFFEEIAGALVSGQEVKLSGFGSFQLREKRARPGRNPKTGETALISARRVVVFHPSHKLKLAVAPGNRSSEAAGTGTATARRRATRSSLRAIEEFI
ncbi:integration host factor subunit alpha [Aromatoleum toluclasticum]|uniref:integration host factor subunit alpha n=1 Tax=Aromatoleum toluclasticum TaxID=92003 RepID=UPI000591777D|nr:integration host factor subunit alpha [Aromatoleum toluclasticum]